MQISASFDVRAFGNIFTDNTFLLLLLKQNKTGKNTMNQSEDGITVFPPNIKVCTFVLWYVLTTLSIFAVKFATPLFMHLTDKENAFLDNRQIFMGISSIVSVYVSFLVLLLLMKLKFKKLGDAVRGIWGQNSSNSGWALTGAIIGVAAALEFYSLLGGANAYVGKQTAGSFALSFVKELPKCLFSLLMVNGLLQRRYIERPLHVGLAAVTLYWLGVMAISWSLTITTLIQTKEQMKFDSLWDFYFSKIYPLVLVSLPVGLFTLLFSAYLYKRTRSLTPALTFNLLLWFFGGLLGFLPPDWALL